MRPSPPSRSVPRPLLPLLRAFLVLLLALTGGGAHAAPSRSEHVQASLIAENLSFQAGDRDNWVALRLKPDPGWHVYWRNPGDSGIPTKLVWRLPKGTTAGDILWPYPERQVFSKLVNYGYSVETLHLVPIRVAAGSKFAELQATAKWLVCKNVCIPGEAVVSLAVPLSSATPKPDPRWTDAFARARSRLPVPKPGWKVQFAVADKTFSLDLQGAKIAPGGRVDFFPYPSDLVDHAAPQRVALDPDNGFRLSQATSPYFMHVPASVGGVVVVDDSAGEKAYEITAQPGDVPVVPLSPQADVGPVPGADQDESDAPAPAPAAPVDASLLAMVLFAFLGGLILNLMPCVFPVLAMKALSVMHARGDTAAGNRRHALAYAAGVIGSFVVAALVLIALRAGGAQLGWGFQLQSPAFVYALIVVIFAMGLSLSGAIQFGAAWMGAGQSLAARPGLAGSFFTGVLAVVVASPCTAPFMAPALGFALAQPGAGAVLIFAMLGLGLAAPFLLVGFVPRLASFLPRPGAWMETFKQLLAFPMYLTAVWLLYVLGGLTDREGMGAALVGVVLAAFAVWLATRERRGLLSRAIGLAAFAGVIAIAFHPALRARPAEAAVAEPGRAASGWEPYSDARFDALRRQGRSIFVDFTADWCLTCKINERGALASDRVAAVFRDRDVALLRGDWTRSDPAITAVLRRYGRSGVPLYLASDEGAEPRVLPQVLTPGAIVEAYSPPAR